METKTSNFILPLIGNSIDFYNPYLVDCFLKEENAEPEQYVIQAVFTWKSKPGYEQFLDYLRQNPCYRGEYQLCDGDYVIFLLEVPDLYKNDYNLFLLGKYSHFSKEAKALLLKGRSANSSMSDILNKGKKLREYWENKLAMKISPYQELFSIYKEEEETLYKKNFLPLKSKNNIIPSSEFDL